MRNILLSLFALMLLLVSSCQSGVTTEKEKAALLDVLRQEAEALIAGDMEAVSALHMQDELETRLELGIYGYNTYSGWDEIKALLEDASPGLQHGKAINVKEKVTAKVTGNTAWLSCDNIWKWEDDGEPGGYDNIQVVFFEKIKGEWKISFASYYSKAVPVQNY